ncbi:AAA family ATPase [Nonomuraea sp. FMUSA5-5]|uniref:AAA family ATPase n=1 Tax=Nonomuraea composti TaxID=2720023 RepID=A0ABX1B9H2_9ACTN|nr:AAA family ATPase [Nonomuraea sp. FMUSA5-5]NJP94196.1 AAA family ATPase [Nonomuraea sp. FMUSA5-5]
MPSDAAAHELIGREHPAALLRAEITRLIDSHGGLVLVTGEAGIGKTTLVTSTVGEARRRGALVVAGACWDAGGAPGYWPWVQVIRALRRTAEPEEWAAEEAAGGSLTTLLGEARATPEPSDAFRVFDAVTSTLVTIAQRRPVVVVIDDLHAADPASLRLLEFAARQTWFERLLLIGTYRDAEVEPVEHPLRDLLSPLVAKATTITLTGLDRAGVAALMARTAGHDPPPDLVDEVHVRTGGNPFFVEQTSRLWRSGGSAGAVAPGVRDALLRRLSLLPRQVAELLPAAAVLGREFHRQVLAAAIGAPVAHVDRLLELAVVAKLIVTKGGGVFAFAHDLVRETLYDSLDDPRDRHAAVVTAVRGSPALAGRLPPSDLAGGPGRPYAQAGRRGGARPQDRHGPHPRHAPQARPRPPGAGRPPARLRLDRLHLPLPAPGEDHLAPVSTGVHGVDIRHEPFIGSEAFTLLARAPTRSILRGWRAASSNAR